MIIRKVAGCERFIAPDGSLICELLHPSHEQGKVPIGYSIAHASVMEGKRTQRHRLTASEVYYILKGKGEMVVDGERQEVGPGEAIYIPPDSIQFISNQGKGDLEFLAIVEPPWRKENDHPSSSSDAG